MAKKKPSPFSGVLLVNKPLGITSHDVVSRMRKYLNTRTVGHAGTLDPQAEGLMMILVGQGTKLSQWVTLESKAYEGIVTLGKETASGDSEGAVTGVFQKKEASLKEVELVVSSLCGEQELFVPKYSAIKVQGRKLYEKARSGESVACPKRKMIFYKSEVVKIEGSNIHFSLKCSKGSYIRSWAVELGKRLGTGAFLSALKRVEVGPFHLKQASKLEEFKVLKEDFNEDERVHAILSSDSYISPAGALPYAEIVMLNQKEEQLFSTGQIPNDVRLRISPLIREAFREEKSCLIRMMGSGQRLAGVLSIDEKGKLKIQRVFNLGG